MSSTHYKMKKDGEILSYIDGFPVDSVIWGDYFYAARDSIFQESFRYSDEQIARILNLTDREYAELVHDYVNADVQTAPPVAQQQKDLERIRQIEDEINASKDLENAQRRLLEVVPDLERVAKDLESKRAFHEKYESALKEFNTYSHLKKFNLNKVHEDLEDIIVKINRHEMDLLNFKGQELQNSIKEEEVDKGKIVLGIGWGIAFFLFGYILLLIDSPRFIIYGGWGVGAAIFLYFVLTSKVEVEYVETNPNGTSYHDITARLEQLKQQKNQILQLIGFKHPDDFFKAKAQLGAASKTLQYIKEQEQSSGEESYETLLKHKEALEQEKVDLETKIGAGTLLSQEQYLGLYRELDALKLGQSKKKEPQGKPELAKKLSDIRQELITKLPGFCSLLRNNFKTGFARIKEKLDAASASLQIAPFVISDTGDGYDSNDMLHKILIQFYLAMDIYHENFAFILENSGWNEVEMAKLTEFAELPENATVNMIILDEE